MMREKNKRLMSTHHHSIVRALRVPYQLFVRQSSEMSSTHQQSTIKDTDRPLDSDTLIIRDDEAIEIISFDQIDW